MGDGVDSLLLNCNILGLVKMQGMLWDCLVQVTLHPPLDVGARAAWTMSTTSVISSSEESPLLLHTEGRRQPHWYQAPYSITVTRRYSAHSFLLHPSSMPKRRPAL